LSHDMPILEDTLAALAIELGPDNGAGDPRLRLDVVGKHDVGVGAAPRALYEALVLEPLTRAGLRIPEIDRYAVELQPRDHGGRGQRQRRADQLPHYRQPGGAEWPTAARGGR